MPKPEYKNAPRTNQNRDNQGDDKDTVDAENEKWNPTPEVFAGFLVRDLRLATANIRLLMQGRQAPMSAKELKDQTLHSTDCIEQVLSAGVSLGTLTEVKGKYSLVGA